VAQYREIGDYCDEIFRDLLTILTAARNAPGIIDLATSSTRKELATTTCSEPGICWKKKNSTALPSCNQKLIVQRDRGAGVAWDQTERRSLSGDKEILANYGIDSYFSGK
jgi:hypothetical protein